VDAISDALRALTLECDKVAGDVLLSARLREW
jgi:diaminohydroxyphosphoribosylaminopyrimidine deaminase / 5-amino-6-(5-phosphoribosylamino)uracil reductase